MWTAKNRARYERKGPLRYPSDLTDEEWGYAAPLISPAKRGGRKREVNVREVLNGIMYVLSTGCQWSCTCQKIYRLQARSLITISIFGTTTARWSAFITSCTQNAGKDGPEASPTACVIDSQSVKSAEKGGPASRSTRLRRGQENQRQEAAHPRRYGRPVAACRRSQGRHSGSRRRHSGS